MENRPRYRVPDELRETLLDFTIAYLLERPANLPTFGLHFFQRLKDEHEIGHGHGPRTSQTTPQAINGEENDTEGNLILDELVADWILQFSIVYIVEQPPNILDFGIRYCEKKKNALEAEALRIDTAVDVIG